MLGGSFDPAAIFEISTVAASVSPAVNRRVVALTSIWLNDNLQVEPSRAIIKFEALPEANLGIGAQTIAGEIDNMEKHMGMEGSGHKRKLSTLSRRGSWFRPPSRKNSIDDRGDPRQYLGFTPIASPISPPPIAPASPPQTAPAGPEKDGLLMKAKKRKNLASIFKR